MTNFIEEQFFGNLDPQMRSYTKDSRIVKASGNINELDEKLTERLHGEYKDLFLDFCNAYGELMGDAEVDSFTVGFRMGSIFAVDTFCDDE